MITGTTITKDAITPAMERIQTELAQYPQQALSPMSPWPHNKHKPMQYCNHGQKVISMAHYVNTT